VRNLLPLNIAVDQGRTDTKEVGGPP
jgi:hypothetical protein